MQGVAGHLAVVVSDNGVDAVGLIGQHRIHHEGDGSLAGSLLGFNAVDIPVQVFRLGILAAEFCLKGVVHAQNAGALARNFNRCAGKDCGHVQVLLEGAVGAGTGGNAVAPVDEEIAISGHSRHSNRLVCRHIEAEGCLTRSIAAGQSAASMVDPVMGLKSLPFLYSFRGAGGHRIAGIAGVLQGPGGDVAGIGAAVLRLVGMSGQVVQNCLQAAALEVNIAADIVIILAEAGGRVLQDLCAVEEFNPQILAHGQQCHVEVINLLLRHRRIVGMILGDRRNGIDNDISIRIARLDVLDQLGIVFDEGLHFHAVIVGPQGDNHTAGLHHGHSLGHGVALVSTFEGDQLLRNGILDADPFFGAELLQGNQAVVVQADRIGITQEQGFIQIGLASVIGFGQQGCGLSVDLIMGGQIVRLFYLLDLAGAGAAALGIQQHIGDAGRNQNSQCADGAHKNCLFLDRCHRL